jgi:hypothetical protein
MLFLFNPPFVATRPGRKADDLPPPSAESQENPGP